MHTLNQRGATPYNETKIEAIKSIKSVLSIETLALNVTAKQT